MNIVETELEGVLIVEPRVFADARGTFAETFSERDFAAALGELGMTAPRFVQDNESRSRRGVVRGLHFQREPHAQAKLVRVARGSVLDVAVDMRAGSPTLGRHVAVELSADNGRQLFVPRGFAHGFVAREDDTTVIYKVDGHYAPESDGGVLWCDPRLAIDWGVATAEAIVSDKDAALPEWEEAYKFPMT
jgi:dTDP-4-dehydrorhamnose 3,5-epimerase